LLAAAIMAADWVYTVQSGETLQLGPARAFWVAGPLAVYAVVKIVFRLLEH
jgi:hypothetical protein